MDGFWQGRGGRLLRVALVVGLLAMALALLNPNHPTGDLGGTEWTLVAYGPADTPIAAEVPASITFEANGRFYGFDGCNRFFGNYRATEGRWEIVDDEVGRTLAECGAHQPDGVQGIFFRTRLTDGNYTKTVDRLTLHFADGQMAAFIPASE